ncbi:hypothetical protein GQX74_005710 [Glossina fuscipes]|nr:hypothetical protein GQX74_005710 [Glossina fuscipes]
MLAHRHICPHRTTTPILRKKWQTRKQQQWECHNKIVSQKNTSTKVVIWVFGISNRDSALTEYF